jgi:hypothetical protein
MAPFRASEAEKCLLSLVSQGNFLNRRKLAELAGFLKEVLLIIELMQRQLIEQN